MKHTFFEKNQYQLVKEFKKSKFTIQYAWNHESTQLELVFDPSQDYWDDMVEKLDNGTWVHIVAKVSVHYDGQEISSDFLGSVICEDPLKWFENDGADQVEGMVEELIEEAKVICINRLAKMQADFS